ncbi:MAG: methyltransferase domain-containing protein [Methylococcaceae bacterium]|jgi:SAM-dependent methyltransferase
MLKLQDVLNTVATQYPTEMIEGQIVDIPRIFFNINIALAAVKHKSPNEVSICDLGGGVGLFSSGCAAYGLNRTVLVDDFDDSINHKTGDAILDIHRKLGVEIISRDVVEKGISDITGNFDIITTFDSMEHWHHSPKKLFHEIVEKLNPGGAFVLGVPNCVNMRKRITVPLGIGKWSQMQDWYEVDKFRAHVREPDVSDLKYIANDMGLVDVNIYGRNWLGYYSTNKATRFATKIMDYPLRLTPTLCSDIYMIGKKA